MLTHSATIDRHKLLSQSGSLLVLFAGLLMADAAVGEDKMVKFTASAAATDQTSSFTPAQLEQLVGPIALYPDDLIGIILPAATQPVQIVQALRYLEQHATDADLDPDPGWDEAVIALLNYPEVLRLMDGNLDWTVKLGQAIITQQEQVMDAIQQFRRRANAAGNLNSDTRQQVVKEGDTIEIKPADPEVIYVPSYEPEQVIVRQFAPLYDYSPIGYPVYYYPYAPDYRFSSGFFWGVTTAYILNWNTHNIYSYRSNNYRHPYYRSTYYTNRFLYKNRRTYRSGNWNTRRTSTNVWRSESGRDRHPAVTTGALPQRQAGQVRQLGVSNQSNRNTGSFANRGSGTSASTSGGGYQSRNQYRRNSGTADRRRSINNRSPAASSRSRPALPQGNRNTNTRSVQRSVVSTAAAAAATTNSSSNNSQNQSRPVSSNNSDNNGNRLQLRSHSGNSFTPQRNRARLLRR